MVDMTDLDAGRDGRDPDEPRHENVGRLYSERSRQTSSRRCVGSSRMHADAIHPHLLRFDGERRGEEAEGQRAHERPPVHHSIT